MSDTTGKSTMASAIFAGVALIISFVSYKDSTEAAANANRIAAEAASEVERFNQKSILQKLVLSVNSRDVEYDDKILAVSGHLLSATDDYEVDKYLELGQIVIFDRIEDIDQEVDELLTHKNKLQDIYELAVSLDQRTTKFESISIKVNAAQENLKMAESEQSRLEASLKEVELSYSSKRTELGKVSKYESETPEAKTEKNKQLELLQFKLESDNKLISNIRSELDRARIKTGESRELSATLVSGQQEILAQLQKNKNDFQASLEGRRYVLSSIKNSADHGIEIAQKNTNKKMQSTPKGAG